MADGEKSYAGDVTCEECWEMLAAEEKAQLVDVRTNAEWTYVGVPVLTLLGKEALLAEWQSYPDMKTDPDFAENLADALSARGSGKEDPVLFLCRSGGRSKSAATALTLLGFTRAYNVLGGFEGDKDSNGHRGNLSGWKVTGLPWMQR